MDQLLTFASETLIIIAFLIGYRLGKTGDIPTLKDIKDAIKPNKTKVFNNTPPLPADLQDGEF